MKFGTQIFRRKISQEFVDDKNAQTISKRWLFNISKKNMFQIAKQIKKEQRYQL